MRGRLGGEGLLGGEGASGVVGCMLTGDAKRNTMTIKVTAPVMAGVGGIVALIKLDQCSCPPNIPEGIRIQGGTFTERVETHTLSCITNRV